MKYSGPDASMETNILDCGFLYSEHDPRSEGDLRVVYSIGNNRFDWADFKVDLDFWSEFDWINKKEFLSHLGLSQEDFDGAPLWNKIFNAYAVYGYQNVCGESYSGGFEIYGVDEE